MHSWRVSTQPFRFHAIAPIGRRSLAVLVRNSATVVMRLYPLASPLSRRPRWRSELWRAWPLLAAPSRLDRCCYVVPASGESQLEQPPAMPCAEGHDFAERERESRLVTRDAPPLCIRTMLGRTVAGAIPPLVRRHATDSGAAPSLGVVSAACELLSSSARHVAMARHSPQSHSLGAMHCAPLDERGCRRSPLKACSKNILTT